MQHDGKTWILTHGELSALLEFAGLDEARARLCGIGFGRTGTTAYCFATDGHRLLLVEQDCDGLAIGPFLISRDVMQDAVALEHAVSVEIEQDQARVRSGTLSCVTMRHESVPLADLDKIQEPRPFEEPSCAFNTILLAGLGKLARYWWAEVSGPEKHLRLYSEGPGTRWTAVVAAVQIRRPAHAETSR